jgi:hypothetical protein
MVAGKKIRSINPVLEDVLIFHSFPWHTNMAPAYAIDIALHCIMYVTITDMVNTPFSISAIMYRADKVK